MADKDELAGGLTAAAGLYDAAARARATEVLARVEAEGIETLRIVFADQHGVLRGKAVVAGALPSVFRNGLAMTLPGLGGRHRLRPRRADRCLGCADRA
ncbi:MAG: hypothetical protein CVT80_17165 [Alphaproteobacteria bacterium HGW-Alphaproteobacteria-2]|nr:MAG: hypothetical protein CVT80_17165 [Alphaproteobacteria bacterium HGW-Alphaproteobacteria-2]